MLTHKLISLSSEAAQPIQFVGAKASIYTGRTADISMSLSGLTNGIGTVAEAGDFVVVYFGTADQTDRNIVVSGFTELVEIAYINSTAYTGTNLAVAYKFMTATPDSSVVIPGGTLSSSAAGALYVSVWRNVNTSTPFDVTRTTVSARYGADLNLPAITPVTPGAYIVAGGVSGHTQGTQTFTSSDLTDFRTAGGLDTFDVTMGFGYKQWVSGSFDPAPFGFTGTSGDTYDTQCGVTLALRPK